MQNAPMTWGVVVKDGLAYVNDINNGLCGSCGSSRGREDLAPPVP